MAEKTIDLEKLKVSKKKFNPGPARSRAGVITNFLFLCAVGFLMVIPLVYVVCNAFKPMDELFLFPPRLIVQNPTLANFTSISTLMSSSWVPFSRYIFNTIYLRHVFNWEIFASAKIHLSLATSA